MSEMQMEREEAEQGTKQQTPLRRSDDPPGYRAAARARREKISPFLKAQIDAIGVAEAIVILKDGGLAATAIDTEAMAADLGGAFVIDERAPSQMVLKAHPPKLRELRRIESVGMKLIDGGGMAAGVEGPRSRLYADLGVMIGDVGAQGAEQLANDERVEYVASAVAFSLVRPVRAETAQPATPHTWGIEALGVPRLWSAGLSGRGVLVGHLDTGADGTHPALSAAIKEYLFVTAAGFPGAGGTAKDSGRHGTHTAGTIAGRAVGGRAVGVAPGAKLAVATVIEGGDVAKRIITGLSWAVRNGVRIVNLSLGFRGYVNDLYAIMQRVRDRGVLPVVAVGNEGVGTSRSPGNYDLVLSVGACDEDLRIPDFSSSQRFQRERDPIVPDVVAPGVNVISAKAGGGWLALDGSSMAAPHVAGLAALLWEAKPAATVDEVERAIFDSAKRSTHMSEARAGRGLPNGPEAYRILTGQALPAAAQPASTAKRKAAKSKSRTAKRKTSAGAKRRAAPKKAAAARRSRVRRAAAKKK